jgi:glycosyltransferase involved in cell wall biosynthesis
VRPAHVTVLPNGVDVDVLRPDAAVRTQVRNELGLNDEFLWCTAGRLEPVKDYPTLLRAFAGLPESARLAVAGSGSQESTLLEIVGRLGIRRRVRFLGFKQDVCRWMQAADGFVLSSLWEGLPVSLLEAGACGLPSVATAVAGAREVVVDGQTGYLAQPRDVNSLTRAMAHLMRMPPESRRAMGMHSRQRVVQQFSLSSVLDRWEALYCELLEANPHPRRWAGSLRRPGTTASAPAATSCGAGAGAQLR